MPCLDFRRAVCRTPKRQGVFPSGGPGAVALGPAGESVVVGLAALAGQQLPYGHAEGEAAVNECEDVCGGRIGDTGACKCFGMSHLDTSLPAYKARRRALGYGPFRP